MLTRLARPLPRAAVLLLLALASLPRPAAASYTAQLPWDSGLVSLLEGLQGGTAVIVGLIALITAIALWITGEGRSGAKWAFRACLGILIITTLSATLAKFGITAAWL